MTKDDLLKRIAESAYNIGFGAKKHFSTYDIVCKIPGLIGFISMAIGIFALYIQTLSNNHISAILTVFGILSLLISQYNDKIEEYNQKGIEITKLFNKLKTLYFTVKSNTNSQFDSYIQELENIENEYLQNSISKQISFSDWYAHYKFFWQHQIEWIEEQKKFSFWRDKIPLSFMICVIVIISVIVLYFVKVGFCK